MKFFLRMSLAFLIVSGSGQTSWADPPTEQEKQVDRSIVAALRYLSAQQRPSGAWQVQSRESHAGTSLAVMAFLAAGHVPGEGPYGKQLERGISWVISNQHNSGLLTSQAGHGAMYEHGISSLMLAEVVGMVGKREGKETRDALQRAIRVILNAQNVAKPRNHAGGWRYNPTSRDSDLSVTGWQLLALRAAKNVGCDVPADNIDAAIAYVKRCGGISGFGYTSNRGATPTMTGTGIVALEVCGEHRSPEVLKGASYLLNRRLGPRDTWFYYGAYYCTVGMFKVGGDYWKQAKPQLVNTILSQQREDGSWKGTGGESGPGTVYATSLSVLALGVEYQYLPIYQR